VITGCGSSPVAQPPAGRPDPQPGEASQHRPLGPLSPRHLLPGRPHGEPLQADRPRRVGGDPGPLLRTAAGRDPRLGPPRLPGEDDHLVGDTDDVARPRSARPSRNGPETPEPESATTTCPGRPSPRAWSSNSKAICPLLKGRRALNAVDFGSAAYNFGILSSGRDDHPLESGERNRRGPMIAPKNLALTIDQDHGGIRLNVQGFLEGAGTFHAA